MEHLQVTSTLIHSLIVIGGLMLFFIIASIVIKRADPTVPPKGLIGFFEFIYVSLADFTMNAIGEKGATFIPFVITAASYLAIANLLGLVGLTPPTSNINVTVALTILTLIYIMISGMVQKGFGKYLRDTYVGDIKGFLLILLVPITIIGELSKIISLSFRLFGNIVSGVMILTLLTQFMIWLGQTSGFGMFGSGVINLSVYPFLNAYFDIFAGLMQTFIFCTLTTMFIKSAVESDG